MVSAAIVLPLILIVVFLMVELGRLLMAYAFTQEVLGQTLKFAVSRDPYADDVRAEDFMYSPSDQQDSRYARRRAFWVAELSQHGGGKNYFTKREQRVFNLAYGTMKDLNPSVYFPIPVPDSGGATAYQDLDGHTTCSLSFRFAPDDAWKPSGVASNIPPASLPAPSAPSYSAVMNADRNRIYTLECRVPLIGPPFFRQFLGSEFVTLRSSIYAYHSGGIAP